MNKGEYSPRGSRGEYSPTFSEPEANNCFSIIFKGEYQGLQNNGLKRKTQTQLFVCIHVCRRVWMGGPHLGCRLKFPYFVGCRLKIRPLSAVGKSQLFFLSLVGNCFLVLSVVSSIFSPFVASRWTPFTPSCSRGFNNKTTCTSIVNQFT